MANISSATSGNWRADDADTWGLGIGNYPAAGDLVTILNGHDVTLVEDNVAGAVVINSGGTITGGGNKLTLDDNAGTTFIFSSVGSGVSGKSAIEGVLDIDITGGSADRPINEAGTGNIRNLVINNAQTYLCHYHLTLDGNLTITEGTLNTQNSGGTDNNLTVGTNTDDGGATGHLRIKDAGELICNSSTVIVGSVHCEIASGSSGAGFAELNLPDSSGSFTVRGPEVSNYVFRLDNQAECNHNGGTVTFSLTAENHASIMDVTSLQGTGVNNILVTQSVRTSNGNSLQFQGSDQVKGNLTLTGNGSQSCIVDTNYDSASLTVDGDVTVNNHSTLIKRTTNTGNYSFGSLTINSGGTYNATSGTTTITNESSSGLAINNDGTFTHNKGTVKIDYDSTTSLDLTGTGSVNLYNLIVDSDATVSYGASVIENNLTKQGAGLMRPDGDSGRNLTVKGTFLMQAGSFGRGANDTHTNTFGNIVVEGGELILTGGGGSGKTIVNGVFRNVGGTITSH